MAIETKQIRKQFPALSLSDEGILRTYLDNPAGTQVPQSVINRMQRYLIHTNANHEGRFRTSRESDAILAEAHQAMADLLNASSPKEIIFGPNMTTLTFAISRSLGHWFHPGDEIIVTRMDHDANVRPWLLLAKDHDLKINWLPFSKETYRFEPEDLARLLTRKVKLAAFGYASNAIGTINDVKMITAMAHDAGVLTYVDAVQYVPHGPTDVQDIGCDFLVCSAYKFFGPHQGILWGKQELLEKLPAYKVRPAGDQPPGKFETGTQSHEGQAGTLGALKYLEQIGQTMAQEFRDQFPQFEGRRKHLHAAMAAIKDYERSLSSHLIEGLQNMPGVKIHGITSPGELDERVPTISFTHESFSPADIARRLEEQNIFVWDGHYYAVEVIDQLGLSDKGGMVRVGAVHYNTPEELDCLLQALNSIFQK